MRVWQEQRRSKIREIRNEKQEKNGEKENKNVCYMLTTNEELYEENQEKKKTEMCCLVS